MPFILALALATTGVLPVEARAANGLVGIPLAESRIARVADRLAAAGMVLCRPTAERVAVDWEAGRIDAAARVTQPEIGQADRGCRSAVEIVTDTTVNAWADGERVVITTTLLAACRTDDELALVIGHEMSHNILHHRRRLATAGVEMGLLPVSTAGSAAMRQTEEEADGLAVRLVAAAGYDLSQAVPFVRRLLAANDLNGRAAATHPRSARRLALLTSAVARTTHGSAAL